jgi:hypothetical protein
MRLFQTFRQSVKEDKPDSEIELERRYPEVASVEEVVVERPLGLIRYSDSEDRESAEGAQPAAVVPQASNGQVENAL